MAENSQLSDETKNNSTDTSSTDASSAVIGNHENAVVPHKISNHDKLVQTMVMVDGEWINVNDTNDQANMKEDMHKVNKKVVEAQKGIVEAKNTADSAVKYADSAVSASKVNSDALVAQSSAISEAKAAADDAASKAQFIKENASSEAAAIRNQVADVANNVSSVKADVASATSDVANLKVDVQANSAAIIKTNEAVSVQSKSSSDAINELKIANGQVESIAKDAKNNATVAKQTADTATTLAQDARSNAVLATQTATSATVEATNASSAATKAELSVSGLTTRVTAIEGDNNKLSNQITSTETILQQAKDQLLQKADKSVVDQANNLISQLSSEQKIMAGQIEQKASSTELDNALTSIKKNTTAIDENSKAIKLKADATEVNSLKNTVNSHSASINLFSDQLKSMVTESKVDDIINEKGFTTQSTVQSIVNQKAGQLSESITQLDTTFKTGMENSVQLVRKSDFEDGSKGNWTVHAVVSATNPAPPAELGQPGMKVLQTNTRDGYEDGIWYSVKPGEKFDVDYWCAPSPAFHTTFGLLFVDKNKNNYNWQGISSDQSGQWKHYIGTITAPPNASFAKPWYHTENSSWLAKPSIRRQNASTVNAIQTLTASIDGLQSAVTNYQKDASSKYTQLSDLMQSKVNKGELESVRTQLASSINERIQKGNLITQFNLEAGRTLIQSNKIYFDAESFVMSPNSKAFIPSAYITNINADKITTGTLDAAKLNVKNFSADNITSGTLNGVVVKTGANDRYFKTSKDNIYWVRKGSMSLIGNDTYLNSANGLSIADEKNIQLTTWGGASVGKDGSIKNNSGNIGHPKIVIDAEGKYNPDDIYGSAFGGGPGNSEIAQWVGNKEYTVLTHNQGFTVHLNDGNNKSIFAIQKDNKVGVYVGGGDDGNEIQIAGSGPIKLQGKYIDDGFNDGMTHTFGNVQVDNLHVRKWLGVDQSKNAIVKTSQGPVTINAYETAEYYFGDIGEGQTSADGIAYIGIEKLFNETVNTTIPYHVFITAYGAGNIWVDQREHNRFIVKSDQPNLKFSWEIKAKRKGYEHTRLQNVDDKLNRMAATS